MKRLIFFAAGLLLALFLLMQVIPVPRTNPPVTREVHWDSPQTRALAKRACLDCHSNETVWPWYSNIAPVKFLLANHVAEGREKLNFSQWDQPNEDFEEVDETMKEGEMPPWDYLLPHAEARLSAAETEQLLSGLRATYAQDPAIAREKRGRGGGDDD
jgi:mono/diheme cytochrome c family protein